MLKAHGRMAKRNRPLTWTFDLRPFDFFHDQTKYRSKMRDDPFGGRSHFNRMAKQRRERCDAFRGEAAGNDPSEIIEVGVHIQRKAVRSDPARKMYAHGGKLAVADPHARRALQARGPETEITGDADQHLFQRAHVPSDVPPMPREVENRGADPLPGPVISDVAAAVGLNKVNAFRCELLR